MPTTPNERDRRFLGALFWLAGVGFFVSIADRTAGWPEYLPVSAGLAVLAAALYAYGGVATDLLADFSFERFYVASIALFVAVRLALPVEQYPDLHAAFGPVATVAALVFAAGETLSRSADGHVVGSPWRPRSLAALGQSALAFGAIALAVTLVLTPPDPAVQLVGTILLAVGHAPLVALAAAGDERFPGPDALGRYALAFCTAGLLFGLPLANRGVSPVLRIHALFLVALVTPRLGRYLGAARRLFPTGRTGT